GSAPDALEPPIALLVLSRGVHVLWAFSQIKGDFFLPRCIYVLFLHTRGVVVLGEGTVVYVHLEHYLVDLVPGFRPHPDSEHVIKGMAGSDVERDILHRGVNGVLLWIYLQCPVVVVLIA